jgi:hypothetical protein
LLLKVLIRETHADNRSTVRTIRQQLSSLHLYMPTVGHDIPKFNQHVKALVDSLNARGETVNDLLGNLLTAYSVVPDKAFVEYIRTKESAYDEGEDIQAPALMIQAANKYHSLKERGVWAAPSPEEEKIVALEAKLQKMQQRSKPRQQERNKGNADKQKEKEKTTPTPSSNSAGKSREKPKWMTKEPQDKSKSKVVDKKEYWWCPNHKSFVRHKPSECKGVGFRPAATAADPSLKLNSALQAVMDQSE